MACITRIKAQGVANCSTGASNGIDYDLVYPEQWTLVQAPNCASGTSAPRSPQGEIHPTHRFSSIVSITYEGCGGANPNQPSINPSQPYDCVNGGCVPKTTYNTPGVYSNLSTCQAGCAKNSTCNGECVSTSELAALQQAANNLQARNCK